MTSGRVGGGWTTGCSTAMAEAGREGQGSSVTSLPSGLGCPHRGVFGAALRLCLIVQAVPSPPAPGPHFLTWGKWPLGLGGVLCVCVRVRACVHTRVHACVCSGNRPHRE